MSAVDQTPTFKLNLPTFDLRVWHTYVNENFSVIDSVLQHYLKIENLVGVWRNATQYHAGERAVDAENGAIYECLLDNISASVPTTFAQDRVSNPAYWGGFTVTEDFRGTWTNSTPYAVQDFVVSGNIYAVCLTSHTSVAAPGVFGDDAVYWIYLINLTGNVLPSIIGHGGNYIRARLDETATEYRTPTQVVADLGLSSLYLPLTGGVLTGALTVPSPIIINGAVGTSRNIIGQTSGSTRWVTRLGNTDLETGSNAGSNFSIDRYTDAGAIIDQPLLISRATGQSTFNQNLTIASTIGASLIINVPPGSARNLAGQSSGNNRWVMYLGTAGTESGGNANADFRLDRYTDAGTLIDAPLTITRSTGVVTAGGATGANLAISAPAGTPRTIAWQANGVNRFYMQLTVTAEGGSNSGSDFAFSASADAGTTLGSVFSVVRSTRVVTFAVAIVNPSDIRLKTHISPITNALEVVSKMQAIWYREKAAPEISKLGLIAQDVRKILPEVVHETAEESEDGDKILGIDYIKIVPMLVEAVKELSARVKLLEART